MNRRKILEKFVALSSIFLVLSGCTQTPQRDTAFDDTPIPPQKKKFKNIISDEPMTLYGTSSASSQQNRRFRPIK